MTVPDETAVDTSESAGSSAESVSVAEPQSDSGGDSTAALRSKIKDLEAKLAKETGKAGATQATLTQQLTAQANRAQIAESKNAELARDLKVRDILDAVTDRASEKRRGAVRAMARGFLPDVDISDPQKAIDAVLAKIESTDPEAMKQGVQHMPHGSGDRSARVGLAFTRDGKRLI